VALFIPIILIMSTEKNKTFFDIFKFICNFILGGEVIYMLSNLYLIALILVAVVGIYGLTCTVFYDYKLKKMITSNTIKNKYSNRLKSSVWILTGNIIFISCLMFIRFKFL
jgi:hypothetical protein